MEIVLVLIILIFSAILHEVAHGFVADRFGDPTARLAGRLTLDPRPHIDPVGSILLPLLLAFQSFFIPGGGIIFGWAKPVPIDPFNLREGRKDLALVSLAGPLTNILLAIGASLLLKLGSVFPQSLLLYPLFAMVLKINLLLAIFNLLPIPPLDGSKVAALLLGEQTANRYLAMGQFGIIILLFLLFFPIGGFSLGELIQTLLLFGENLLLP